MVKFPRAVFSVFLNVVILGHCDVENHRRDVIERINSFF